MMLAIAECYRPLYGKWEAALAALGVHSELFSLEDGAHIHTAFRRIHAGVSTSRCIRFLFPEWRENLCCTWGEKYRHSGIYTQSQHLAAVCRDEITGACKAEKNPVLHRIWVFFFNQSRTARSMSQLELPLHIGLTPKYLSRCAPPPGRVVGLSLRLGQESRRRLSESAVFAMYDHLWKFRGSASCYLSGLFVEHPWCSSPLCRGVIPWIHRYYLSAHPAAQQTDLHGRP